MAKTNANEQSDPDPLLPDPIAIGLAELRAKVDRMNSQIGRINSILEEIQKSLRAGQDLEETGEKEETP